MRLGQTELTHLSLQLGAENIPGGCYILTSGGHVFDCVLDGQVVRAGDEIDIDLEDVVDACPLCRLEQAGASYQAGESASHGSVGFFAQSVGTRLRILLCHPEVNPIVSIQVASDVVSLWNNNRVRYKFDVGSIAAYL